MLQLQQGDRRFRLTAVGDTTVTLKRKAKVKLGPSLLYVHKDPWTVDVTEQDGLTVRFSRRKAGRPRKSVNAASIRALRDSGMTFQAIASMLGVSRDTIWSRLSNGKSKEAANCD